MHCAGHMPQRQAKKRARNDAGPKSFHLEKHPRGCWISDHKDQNFAGAGGATLKL